MLEWLWTNLDEVLGLVLGLTTAGAFWYAYRGRNSVAAVIGLSGNALWWVFAVTVRAWMLLVPVAVMTFIHSFNLWRDRRSRREVSASRVVATKSEVSVPPQAAQHMLNLLHATRSGAPCVVCGHATGAHQLLGCGVILETGAPCNCNRGNAHEETQ